MASTVSSANLLARVGFSSNTTINIFSLDLNALVPPLEQKHKDMCYIILGDQIFLHRLGAQEVHILFTKIGKCFLTLPKDANVRFIV